MKPPIPNCYHHHPKTNFDSPNHTYKGSLIRHIAVEKTFAFASKPVSIMLRKTGSWRMYKLLKFPFEIVFGLNMNLPYQDIIRWVIYYVKYLDLTTITACMQKCRNCGRLDPKLHNEFGSFCDIECFGEWQHKDKLRMIQK